MLLLHRDVTGYLICHNDRVVDLFNERTGRVTGMTKDHVIVNADDGVVRMLQPTDLRVL